MFLAVSKFNKYVPTSAVVGTYLVTCLSTKNMNMFKFSDVQYAKNCLQLQEHKGKAI